MGAIAFAVLVAACGGSDDDSSSAAVPDAAGTTSSEVGAATDGDGNSGSEGVTAPDAADVAEDPEQAASDIAQSLEETQERVGGGSATLTVGDQSWTFDTVLCAFGPDEIGQEGAEFVLSSIQDGMQLYVSIDSYGHSVTLNDIENFDAPSVDLGTVGDGFVTVDGRSATAQADFVDGLGDGVTTVPGTLDASCP